jgi:hypothetical protein
VVLMKTSFLKLFSNIHIKKSINNNKKNKWGQTLLGL